MEWLHRNCLSHISGGWWSEIKMSTRISFLWGLWGKNLRPPSLACGWSSVPFISSYHLSSTCVHHQMLLFYKDCRRGLPNDLIFAWSPLQRPYLQVRWHLEVLMIKALVYEIGRNKSTYDTSLSQFSLVPEVFSFFCTLGRGSVSHLNNAAILVYSFRKILSLDHISSVAVLTIVS